MYTGIAFHIKFYESASLANHKTESVSKKMRFNCEKS